MHTLNGTLNIQWTSPMAIEPKFSDVRKRKNINTGSENICVHKKQQACGINGSPLHNFASHNIMMLCSTQEANIECYTLFSISV
jgi:hypothetical protein